MFSKMKHIPIIVGVTVEDCALKNERKMFDIDQSSDLREEAQWEEDRLQSSRPDCSNVSLYPLLAFIF